MKKIFLIRQNIIINLLHQKKLQEAAKAACQFIKNYPENAFGWKAYGSILFGLGQYQAALEALLKAIAIDKKDPETLSATGNVLQELGRTRDALDCFDKALEIDPNCASAHNGKGVVLQKLKRLDESLECYQKALSLNSGICEFHYNLGSLLASLGRFDEAAESCRRALEINPESSEAYNNLGLALQEFTDLDEVVEIYKIAAKLNPNNILIYSNLLFALNYHPNLSADNVFAAYQDLDRRFYQLYHSDYTAPKNAPVPERQLRIGYVSPDFKAHAAHYFLEPLIAHHDRQLFEITAYAELTAADAVTMRYRKMVDHWVPTYGLTDAELAERIRADGIDILIDLAGHTANNRLSVFARRPAPVSVSWMGYGYTTGLTAIDYFLTDAVMVPPGSEHLFSERLWRIEAPSFIYRPNEGMGEVGSLPALDHGHVTFGCLSRGIRINHRVVGVWSKILHRLPQSRLVIDSKAFVAPAMQTKLAERFAAHGIARERLEIGYHSPPWDVLRSIDISLDCFPHNSGTTLIESLYMGVPFITLAERPSVGRIGSTILVGAGHPEWIAATEADYVDKAVALASDPERLAAIRATLRAELEAGPWRDEAGFARRVEHAYRQMWRRWCETTATSAPDT